LQAFDQRRDEADLVERIRAGETFIPELSLVAEENEEIVGHLLFSKIGLKTAEDKRELLALAPMAVLPVYQHRGIGSLLVREGLKRCAFFEFPLVIVIGHSGYYPRFGFRPVREFGLDCPQYPVADENFMMREIQKGALGRITGTVVYPGVFAGV
jgi:predicted N-acetyltransferase YhbS